MNDKKLLRLRGDYVTLEVEQCGDDNLCRVIALSDNEDGAWLNLHLSRAQQKSVIEALGGKPS